MKPQSYFVVIFCFVSVISCKKGTQDIVAETKKAVVQVKTYRTHPHGKDSLVAFGTGFFVKSNVVLTNVHVLRWARRIRVTTFEGKTFDATMIVGSNTKRDLVLMQVDGSIAPEDIPKLNSEPPIEAERIVVIGNPEGFQYTVSDGIVSAIREVADYGMVLQITAPISRGSSGSPVLNMHGEVVGVATMMAKEGQSLNFAIPIASIPAIISKKHVLEFFSKEHASTWCDNFEEECRWECNPYREQAEREYWNGSYGAAIKYFKLFHECNPYVQSLLLAMSYEKLGLFEEALDAWNRDEQLNGESSISLLHRGLIYSKMGRYEDAVGMYKRLLKIQHSDHSILRSEIEESYGVTLSF